MNHKWLIGLTITLITMSAILAEHIIRNVDILPEAVLASILAGLIPGIIVVIIIHFKINKLQITICVIAIVFVVVSTTFIASKSKLAWDNYEINLEIDREKSLEQYSQKRGDLLGLRIPLFLFGVFLELVAIGVAMCNWRKDAAVNIVMLVVTGFAHVVYTILANMFVHVVIL